MISKEMLAYCSKPGKIIFIILYNMNYVIHFIWCTFYKYSAFPDTSKPLEVSSEIPIFTSGGDFDEEIPAEVEKLYREMISGELLTISSAFLISILYADNLTNKKKPQYILIQIFLLLFKNLQAEDLWYVLFIYK